MNKTKFFALLAVSATMFACGSQDGSQVELKNNTFFDISPFDIIEAKFNSTIVKVDELNDSTGNAKLIEGQKSSSVLQFVGTNTSARGLSHFKDKTTDSIVIKNVENSDEYKKERIVIYYSTLEILDDIVNHENSIEASAKDLDSHLKEKSVRFAGALDFKISGNMVNFSDYYKISLQSSDTLEIIIKATDELSVKLKEPVWNKTDTTFIAKKGIDNTFKHVVGRLNPEERGESAYFYIIVNEDNLKEKPIPYTLSVSIR